MASSSKHIVSPQVPANWPKLSSSNPRSLPFNLLSPAERRFLQSISSRSLISREELIDLLHDCFGDLLQNISDLSIGRNLFSSECYADRVYFDPSGTPLGSIRVFRLGLVVAVPMPANGTRFKHWYCYPSMAPGIKLTRKNFVRPNPPHDAFSSWCFRALHEGLTEDECKSAENSMRKLAHWDQSGEYVADNCLRFRVNGRWQYYWFEVHTGTEGYDESIFIKRLLTAEKALLSRGKFVVIVPFKRDRDKALRAIKSYNRRIQGTEKPQLDLKVSEIITYQGIPQFKEKLGFYKHTTRV